MLLGTGLLTLTSCEKDDDMPKVTSGNFTLTIENVMSPKSYFMAGKTDGIGPGSSYTFSFDAGKGHYLSFATMLAQSNDLFYGFSDMGMSLYDDQGNAKTGVVTDMVYLWDSGTEVNEMPGSGANQAPRQATANTGTTENGQVKMIANVADGFTYPMVSDIIKVMIAHDGGTMFTVTIFNMSDMNALTGPLAPGVWAVHGNNMQLFTENSAAPSGLEMLSEDGNNAMLGDHLMMNAGLVGPFAPGVFAVYEGLNPIFKSGENASNALQGLAEDGNVSMFNFDATNGVNTWETFAIPMGGSAPAPIFPGEKYQVSFMASEGDMLSFATMFVQSNDVFVAPEGISLFSNGLAMTGDITMYLKLWDAKTEMNEFPGAGMYQAPRQAGANMGMDESGMVEMVNDGFTYPAVANIIKVTLSAN